MSELPYDGDLNDSSQRCKHGTFIGSWWGPDYLCGACEMGEDWEPPEPEPECEWIDHGHDMDGSHAAFGCPELARHSVELEDATDYWHMNLCSRHMAALFDTDTFHVDDDKQLWLDNLTHVASINIGKVVRDGTVVR